MKGKSLELKTKMKRDMIWSLFYIQFRNIHSGYKKEIEEITKSCKKWFIYEIQTKSEKIKVVEETFNKIIKYYLSCALECNGYLFVDSEKLQRKKELGYDINATQREFYKIFKNKELRDFFFTRDEYGNYQIDSANKYIVGPSGEIECQIDELVISFNAKLKIPDNENYKEYCNMVFDKFKSVFDEQVKKRKINNNYYNRVIQKSYNEFCDNIKDSESLLLISEIIEDNLIKKVFDTIYEKMESIKEHMIKTECSYTEAIELLVLRSEVEKAEITRQLSEGKDKEFSILKSIKKRRI